MALVDQELQDGQPIADRNGSVCVISPQKLRTHPYWRRAFESQHKDHRYYDLISDTIHPEFEHLYFLLSDGKGQVPAVQPFFILDQDILAGARPHLGQWIDFIRRLWPQFMVMKTMMVGCVAGEGQLDGGSDAERAANAEFLAGQIEKHALALGARLIVLKEYPSNYRETLACFERRGFTRIPSMPLTRLNIAYNTFDEYMQSALNSATRSKLRKKFKAVADDMPIELHVSNDIGPVIDEVLFNSISTITFSETWLVGGWQTGTNGFKAAG